TVGGVGGRRLSRSLPTVTTAVDDSARNHSTCGNVEIPRTRKDAHDAESPAARRQPAATDAAGLPSGIRAPAALRFATALRIPAALRFANPLRVSTALRFPTALWATAELLGLARRQRPGSRPGAVQLTAAAAAGLRHRVRRLLAALPLG